MQLFPILRADGTMIAMSDVETVNALLDKAYIEERVSESGIIHYTPTDAGKAALTEALKHE